MSSFPGSPRLLKGGIVLIDPTTRVVQRIVVLQYNPDTLTRTLQVQSVAAESQNRSEALRLKGPPIETFKLDAEIDATDQLESPDQNPNAAQYGIHPQLTALETIVYPSSAQLLGNNSLAQAGTLEIAPIEAPLSLFIWSRNRIVPVRITDFSVTEEAFDPALNPMWLSSFAMGRLGSASTLVMKVLAVTDFPVIHVLSLVSPNVKTRLVTDTAFAPTNVMVAHGYAEAYADILLKAVGVATPRCLEAPVGCEVHPNDGTLVGGLIAFLSNQPSRAAVHVSSTFSPKSPDPIMLSLVQTQFSLIGVPALTVIKMGAIRGAFAAVSIPKGHYGVSRHPDVPAADVPTAAAPLMLISSTPPKVADRVRGFVRLINSALLDVEPRVSHDNLRKSLELARDLREYLRGRVVLHEEYAKELEMRGLPTILPSPTLPSLPCGGVCGEPGPKGSGARIP